MIRYKINGRKDGAIHGVTLALTDYADVAELLKTAVERDHPDYRVEIKDLSHSPVYFNPSEAAFDDSGKEGDA